MSSHDFTLSPPPTAAAAKKVGVAATALGELAGPKRRRAVVIEAKDDDQDVRAEVPIELFRLFVRMLAEYSQGRAVTLVPVGTELTTQEAAALLNVSRPYVIQLVKDGKLDCRKVGTHRRIRYEDLVRFKAEDDARREMVARKMMEDADELGLEY